MHCLLNSSYYIDENGEKKRPYIIHRTSIGCYERTLAWLIEKYAGMFPTWLCPEQVRVIPISEKFHDYAAKVEAELKASNIRCSVDQRSEKMGYKIREARLARVPYMLIVGAKEEEEQKVSVRSRYLGDEGAKDLRVFIDAVKDEIARKTIRKIEVEDQRTEVFVCFADGMVRLAGRWKSVDKNGSKWKVNRE